jgi:hypothetical protein
VREARIGLPSGSRVLVQRAAGGALAAGMLLVATAIACMPAAATCAETGPFLIVRASNGGTPFQGDTSTLVTVSPNGDGYREAVTIHYRLREDACVRVDASRHGAARRRRQADLGLVTAGAHVYRWLPPPRPVPGSYLLRLSTRTDSATVVVHVLGIDVGAARSTYDPGEVASLSVRTDARGLTVDVLRITAAAPTTRRNDKVQGVPAGQAFHVAWPGRGDRAHALAVPLGRWASGVYFVRLRADDGRVGYTPLVLRPPRLGATRVAVVMPTYTWQAYNFYDRDGDGRGDTWYANWGRHTTRMGRPYMTRGVPAHFNTYDLPFLRWAARRPLVADFLSDADLASLGSGDTLARLYDLIVFPGHHEYVTQGEYDVVTRYRDLGGNLAWLSANNFFWKVVRHGPFLERVAKWRDLGRPEAALIGAQYHGNDEGQRRAPMIVADTPVAAWLFAGTGLGSGDTFGRFGIEIDGHAPSTPPTTAIVARVANLFHNGVDAEMTYYELPNGAKVFAAGAFTLAGLADSHVGAHILDNLFAHLSTP